MNYIYELHKMMTSRSIMLVYEGEFTQEITKSVLSMAERNLESINEEANVRKKVFNVMVECLQNICKHSDEFVADKEMNTAIFMIGKEDGEYFVTTGNPIANLKIDNLRSKLEIINSLDKDGLKELYKKAILESEISEKGGAGLGFIDMARKSGNKLEFDFTKISDTYSFFSLQCKISKQKI
jgi:hypothetical protein